MMNPNKEAHDIINELAEKADKDVDIADPSIQKLILKLNVVARTVDVSALEEERNHGYYSVKDVAELFDVNKQTVYQWIKEKKIEYEEDQSPGKLQRKGYRIPKKQFQTEDQMNEVDHTFHRRREEDMEEIPHSDSAQNNVVFPENDKDALSHDVIKRNLIRKRK